MPTCPAPGIQRDHVEQVKAHDKKDQGDEPVSPPAHIAHHPPGHRGHHADQGDGDQDADRKTASDSVNARPVDFTSCSSMNPTISGMLARWQGLSTMLNTPQIKLPH
jgi:hypothetical protein